LPVAIEAPHETAEKRVYIHIIIDVIIKVSSMKKNRFFQLINYFRAILKSQETRKQRKRVPCQGLFSYGLDPETNAIPRYALPNGSQEERNRRGKYGEEHAGCLLYGLSNRRSISSALP